MILKNSKLSSPDVENEIFIFDVENQIFISQVISLQSPEQKHSLIVSTIDKLSIRL